MSSFLVVFACLLLGSSVLAGPTRRLNRQISYYEPLHLEPSDVLTFNSRRFANDLHRQSFPLSIEAFGKTFDLTLSRSTHEFFSPAVQVTRIVDGTHFPVDLSDREYYSCAMAGQALQYCHFRVNLDGEVSGLFITKDDAYHVRESSRYSRDISSSHVIFRESDWNYNYAGQMDYVMTAPSEGYDNSLHSRNRRGAYTTGNNTCTVALIADYKFYQYQGGNSVGHSVDLMVEHFNYAKSVFGTTTFTANSVTYDVQLAIGAVSVYQTQDSYSTATTHDDYLNRFSLTNWEAYCLAHAFTYIDFHGVVGLAWKGYETSEGSVGGICQKLAGGKYYNTAFTTLLSWGDTVPSVQASLVTTHEFGHNFGSHHDNTTEGTSTNRFVMYYASVDGSAANNDNFSPSSIERIAKVVRDKGGCFIQPNAQICGNGVQEGTEKCDGTSSSTSTDVCCNDYVTNSVNNCKLKSSSQCSPLNLNDGVCCRTNCTFQATSFVCAKEAECTNAATCLTNGTCGAVQKKAVDTLCRSNSLMCNSQGSCSVSTCDLYGLTECVGTTEDLKCRVTCTESATCKRIDTVNASPSRNPAGQTNTSLVSSYKASGAYCYYQDSTDPLSGICDGAGTCKSAKVEETALTKLYNILKGLSYSDVKDWFMTKSYLNIPRWQWLLIGGLLLLLVASCCHYNCQPKKRAARREARASRRAARTNQNVNKNPMYAGRK